MTERDKTMGISNAEQLAGIIAMAVVNEAEGILNDVPRVGKDKLVVKQVVTDEKVVFTVKGELGDKLNNPDITFVFNEYLSKDDLVSDDELSSMLYNNYITLSLMRYTINTQEDKETEETKE